MLHPWTEISPFERFSDLRRDFDRLFDEFAPSERRRLQSAHGMAFAVEEDESGLTLSTDIPGVAPDDLEVTVDGRVLTVTGERKPRRTSAADVVRSELAYGRISRSVQVPDSYDLDNIEAQHENGILTLSVPKSEAAKPRTIAIESK